MLMLNLFVWRKINHYYNLYPAILLQILFIDAGILSVTTKSTNILLIFCYVGVDNERNFVLQHYSFLMISSKRRTSRVPDDN